MKRRIEALISKIGIKFYFIVATSLALLGGLTAVGYLNNFKIFCASFNHLIERKNLYVLYPAEYHDYFLYGSVFAIFIFPFQKLQIDFGKTLWVLVNLGIYLYAIYRLFNNQKKFYFFWLIICFQDIYLSGLSFEINNLMTASIIIAYCFLNKKKELSAGILIGLLSMVKLFPIMALLFFSFEINRKKYLLGIAVGVSLAIIIPMLFTDFNYVLSLQNEWLKILVLKDGLNRNLNPLVDYSLPGLFRKNLNEPMISSVYFTMFGFLILFGLFIKNLMHKNLKLELLTLSILTIFVFNSNSESPSFIISSTAVAIWWNFLRKDNNKVAHLLLIFYIIFSVLPTIDGYPKAFKDEILHAKGFRALPPVIIWFYIIIQSYFKPVPQLNLTK